MSVNNTNDKNDNDNNNNSESMYTNHPEPFTQSKGTGWLSQFLLIFWYFLLIAGGFFLLAFVAIFVACMV